MRLTNKKENLEYLFILLNILCLVKCSSIYIYELYLYLHPRIVNVSEAVHHQVGRLVVRCLYVGDPQFCQCAPVRRAHRHAASGAVAEPRLPNIAPTTAVPQGAVRAGRGMLQLGGNWPALIQGDSSLPTKEEFGLFCCINSRVYAQISGIEGRSLEATSFYFLLLPS